MVNSATRVKTLLKRENITARELERLIGASDGVISKHLRDGSEIQPKWLLKISEVFPIYRTEWLVQGKGEILYWNDKNLQPKVENVQNNEVVIPAEVWKTIADLAAAVKSQQEELREYRTGYTVAEKKSAEL